jgi:hypothetical protein
MVLGSLEHDVLKQVSKPGATDFFVLGPHVVPDVDRYQGNGVVLVKDNVQSI